MINVLIVAGKEIREGLRNRWVLATTLLLGGARAHAHLPRQRANRQRRRARPRRGDRQPLQPHHLPSPADRAPDLARRHRRRDGARHHAAAPELPGRALAGGARQVRRAPRHPGFRDPRRLWRGGAALAATGAVIDAGELGGVRRHGRLLGPARGGVHRHRLSRQRAGARPRHRGGHRDRDLARPRPRSTTWRCSGSWSSTRARSSPAGCWTRCSCSTPPTSTVCST